MVLRLAPNPRRRQPCGCGGLVPDGDADRRIGVTALSKFSPVTAIAIGLCLFSVSFGYTQRGTFKASIPPRLARLSRSF